MLGNSPAIRIYLASGVTDMRKSFNGLYALTQNVLKENPLNGHYFIFCNKRRDRIKVLYWDGSGLWVCAKRLEKGTFRWPSGGGPALEIKQSELNLLLGGMDLKDYKKRSWI